jgi:diacylglycerol kinase family enzyme
VRKVEIDTHPAMPIMTDGNPLGEGLVRVEVKRHALAVMVGQADPLPVEKPELEVSIAP